MIGTMRKQQQPTAAPQSAKEKVIAKLAGGVWVKYYEFSRTVFGARPGPGLAATDPQASSAPGCALLPAAAEQHRRASTRFTSMLGRSTLRIM